MNTSLPPGELPPLALIAGPTASGKSALALALADRTPAVIINADAMQVYADLSVVTARPTHGEMTRHPHALFGYVDGGEACSAAAWAADARAAIAAAHAVGRLSILVGGSGLYIRTLLEGIAPVPAIDAQVRSAVRALPVADAYAALIREDRVAALRLAPADTARVARALEVVRSTGRSLVEWQRARSGGIAETIRLSPLVLAPPRAVLAERIDARFGVMVRDGQDEVAQLLARHLDPCLPVMRAIGVREIGALVNRHYTALEAQAAGALASRQYAKRQITWLARQMPEAWRRWTNMIDTAEARYDATSLLLNGLTR